MAGTPDSLVSILNKMGNGESLTAPEMSFARQELPALYTIASAYYVTPEAMAASGLLPPALANPSTTLNSLLNLFKQTNQSLPGTSPASSIRSTTAGVLFAMIEKQDIALLHNTLENWPDLAKNNIDWYERVTDKKALPVGVELAPDQRYHEKETSLLELAQRLEKTNSVQTIQGHLSVFEQAILSSEEERPRPKCGL